MSETPDNKESYQQEANMHLEIMVFLRDLIENPDTLGVDASEDFTFVDGLFSGQIPSVINEIESSYEGLLSSNHLFLREMIQEDLGVSPFVAEVFAIYRVLNYLQPISMLQAEILDDEEWAESAEGKEAIKQVHEFIGTSILDLVTFNGVRGNLHFRGSVAKLETFLQSSGIVSPNPQYKVSPHEMSQILESLKKYFEQVNKSTHTKDADDDELDFNSEF